MLVDKLQHEKYEKNLKENKKHFRKDSQKTKSGQRQPSMTEFRRYFEKLSSSTRTQNIPSPSQQNGPLDFSISMEELTNARNRLKLGKSHGTDLACNEMLIPLIDTHPDLVLKLFNKILQTSEIIPDWVIGLIVPIYKDGSKMDPNNYRGITLMSCLGKLFLSVLNA